MILRVGMFPYIFILFTSLTAGILQIFGDAEDATRAEPVLQGPAEVCFPEGGFSYVEYTGGGDPTDIFNWYVTDADGGEVYTSVGRTGENRITPTFHEAGTYTVELRVYRNGDQNYYRESISVTVQEMTNQPAITAPIDVLLCGNETETIYAISEANAATGQYCIEWRENNKDGRVLSNENRLDISEEGIYYVVVWLGDCGTAACKVEGWTTAGPPIEFEVIPSTTEVCLGQRVTYAPDTPISGNWYYQKAGQTERTSLGKSYTLELDTDDLDGTGEYAIYFSTEGETSSGCSVEKGPFRLQVNEGLGLTVTKLSDATECDATDGGVRITAGTDLDEITVEGVPGATYSQVSAGQQIEVSGLLPKLYVIRGRQNNCTITRTVNVENQNFTSPVEVDVDVKEEGSCTASGIEGGVVTLTFTGGNGEYTIISTNGRTTVSGSFSDNEAIDQDLPGGAYQIEIRDSENCTSPEVQSFTIPSARQVPFSVPANPTGCEFLEFIPDSDQNLEYILTGPGSNAIPWNPEIGFRIEESGTYTLLGRSIDASLGLCPRQVKMEVTINEGIEFEPVPRYIDCYGNQIYTAELGGGLRASDVIVRWRDSDGEIVGREIEFFPPWPGNFTLEVQPRRSSSCDTEPRSFNVEVPDWSTSVSIDATSYCGDDSFSTLTTEFPGDINAVFIQWFYIDDQGDETELLDFNDQTEIEVADEGLYRVVVRRMGERGEPDCELGQASHTLEKEEGITLSLNDEYQICSSENIRPTIHAGTEGQFRTYIWRAYIESEDRWDEVNRLPSFRPALAGEYQLLVIDNLGCEATTTFTVVDKCKTLARFPNAIKPGDPEKDFRIYVDPMIDNVETYIYNRSGQLIYHCSSDVQEANQPVCIWDGLIDGKRAPIGTYPVIIYVNSVEHQIREEIKKSILVVE